MARAVVSKRISPRAVSKKTSLRCFPVMCPRSPVVVAPAQASRRAEDLFAAPLEVVRVRPLGGMHIGVVAPRPSIHAPKSGRS